MYAPGNSVTVLINMALETQGKHPFYDLDLMVISSDLSNLVIDKTMEEMSTKFNATVSWPTEARSVPHYEGEDESGQQFKRIDFEVTPDDGQAVLRFRTKEKVGGRYRCEWASPKQIPVKEYNKALALAASGKDQGVAQSFVVVDPGMGLFVVSGDKVGVDYFGIIQSALVDADELDFESVCDELLTEKAGCLLSDIVERVYE